MVDLTITPEQINAMEEVFEQHLHLRWKDEPNEIVMMVLSLVAGCYSDYGHDICS